MTNAMTWDAIAANEGSEIEAMSSTETAEVSGGHPLVRVFTQIIKWSGITFGGGYLAQKGANLANRQDGKP